MANGDATNKNSLKAKDIDIIIKAAKEAGVTHFRYKDLEISFSSPKIESKEELILDPKPKPNDGGGIPIKTDLEDSLQELMLMDPLGYEERVHQILEQGADA